MAKVHDHLGLPPRPLAPEYADLAAHFDQQDYLVDIREPGVDAILGKIERMSAKHENESRRIKECLEKLQTTSVVADAPKALEGHTDTPASPSEARYEEVRYGTGT